GATRRRSSSPSSSDCGSVPSRLRQESGTTPPLSESPEAYALVAPTTAPSDLLPGETDSSYSVPLLQESRRTSAALPDAAGWSRSPSEGQALLRSRTALPDREGTRPLFPVEFRVVVFQLREGIAYIAPGCGRRHPVC